MDAYETIQFEVSDGVARLTLNRPDRLNSFNVQMHTEVRQALAQVRDDEACRVLVLTGAGRGFCAGQDLGDRAVAPGATAPDLGESIELRYKPLVLSLRNMPKPVIAAVNGVAAGAGANIALACDLVIAAKSANFIQSFSKLGLVPDSGGTWSLPRLVGQARAIGLAFLGDKLSAEQAATWGLIWRAVEDAELASTVDQLARQLAVAPTRGLARTKEAIYSSGLRTLEQQLDIERDLQRELGRSADYAEGVAAFTEKRRASLHGPMNTPVTLERHGNVALIILDNPPVNAISHAVRAGLLAAIIEADEDPSIQAIVIHGAGRNFIAGADIKEMDQPAKEPLLNDVLLRVEACRKPVVAALHGAVLGGGLETALACHFRCAADDIQMGFPEVKLGLLPGSGGTQRLPRLIGVQAALDMMVSGESVNHAKAQSLGLVDGALGSSGVAESAVEYARGLITAKAMPRRLRERPIPQVESADEEFFAAYRKSLPRAARHVEATGRIIECVEAAVKLPFAAALARSRELFEECRRSGQSAALRHLFFAERATRSVQGVEPARVTQIAVIGAGTMGSGIAVSCATSGYEVTLVDLDAKALEAGHARALAAIDGAVKKGKLSPDVAALARSRISTSSEFQAASKADLVIEAVFENMAVKQDVFRKLDAVCKPGTVLATNTSTLDVDAIADVTRRPESVLGMHFFSPANIMRLVEVVRASRTSEPALATALGVIKRLGKTGVVVGNGFGFVGNRMLYAYGRENQLMQLEGAEPERIDRVLEEWGMAMGPNAVGDLAGLDVGYRVRRERKDPPTDPRYWRVADMLAEMGRHGQKTGLGFYRYEGEKRERKVDPQLADLIRAEARRLDVAQRQITDGEIVERCIFALVNEGARILQEGIVTCAADIDVIWVNGYGFPRTRGGPMFHADQVGLPKVLDVVRKYQRVHGSQYWAPAPLLEDLASTRDSFGTLCAPGA